MEVTDSMKNRIISVALAAMIVLVSVFALSGCGDGEYPVEVANIKIDNEPKNIVVLDADTADIIECVGYEIKMVGRSDEVDQKSLSVAPSVGTAANPDIQKIKDADTDIVFANNTLGNDTKQQLEQSGIKVIKMSVADTPEQLKTNYNTIGKILGGNISGADKGNSAYRDLLDDMQKVKDKVTAADKSGVLNTVCYLYYDGDKLKLMTSGTYGDMLLGYTGCVNVAVNIDENKVDVNTLRIANPNYIFYADDATLNAVKADSVLSNLTAVKENKVLMITANEMNRQGFTALNTLNKMVGFIHPELAVSTSDEATVSTTAPTSANNTAATEAAKSVAKKYNIDLNGLSLEYEDENDNVKAMQQRLYDLGYVTDKENITGYYGDVSKDAVTEFQKKNGIKETGSADNETLVRLFSESAVKAG